jgi:YafQ family addiction module toxin component
LKKNLRIDLMNYTDIYSEEFTKRLKKLKVKNHTLFEAIFKKIDEILQNPERYKPLGYDFKGFHRVHVLKSFVLIFKIDEKNKVVKFEDFDHHDKIYKKRK